MKQRYRVYQFEIAFELALGVNKYIVKAWAKVFKVLYVYTWMPFNSKVKIIVIVIFNIYDTVIFIFLCLIVKGVVLIFINLKDKLAGFWKVCLKIEYMY